MKKHLPAYWLLFAIVILGNNSNLSAQMVQVNSGYTPTQLVQDVFLGGGCVQVQNITFTGSNSQRAYFSNGNAAVGLAEGVLLTSGNATSVPQGISGISSDDIVPGNGDATLNTLANGTTFDAAVLEFDFRPTIANVSFQYAFASEEYPEYVCSSFNDVFGFFISGPGITGTQNIALIPSSALYVGINTVNPGVAGAFGTAGGCTSLAYSAYYNTGNANMVFDGYTDVFTASATVQPCQWYHIKLAIADEADGILDSGVFLSANSFSAGASGTSTPGTVVVNGQSYNGNAYEGCVPGQIVFSRSDPSDTSTPLTLTYTLGGTATIGTDYTATPNLTGTITIPVGQVSVSVNINALSDGITEGTETIIVTLPGNNCTCTGPQNTTINIYNYTPVAVSITPPSPVCGGAQTTVTASPNGGIPLPAYNYIWSTGATTASINVSPVNPTTYTVTVSDLCGTSATANALVSTSLSPNISLVPTQPGCGQSNGSIATTVSGAAGPYTFVWNPALGNIEDPTGLGTNTYNVTVTAANGCTASASTSLTSPVGITASLSNNPTACSGAVNGTATLTTNAGGGATIVWSGPTTVAAGTLNATNLLAGTYNVTVTATNGCTASATTTIASGAPMTASLAPTPTTCSNAANGSITASASGGTAPYTYAWNPASIGNNATANNQPAGNYSVTITAANGCTASATGTIAAGPPMTASITPTPVSCAGGNDGTVTASASGGTMPYAYIWNPASIGNNASANNQLAGSYSVTVTAANGCTASANAAITAPTPLSASIAPPLGVCAGQNNGALDLSISGGTPTYNYNWSNGLPAIEDPANVPPGSYTVNITDANGCTASANTVIVENQATATASPTPAIICVGGSSTLNATGGGTYIWNTGQNGASITVSPQTSTDYTVTVTDTNGCTASAQTTVTVGDAQVVATASPDNICMNQQQSSTLTAISADAVSYLWNTGQNGASISVSPNTTTTYSVVVTTATGCTGSATVTVTVNQATASVQALPDNICANSNEQSTLVASGGVSYVWSTGEVGDAISVQPTATSSYSVTVTDGNGCTASAQTSVTVNQASASASASPAAICEGESSSLTATGGVSYLWSDGQLGANITVSPLVQTTYTVVVTDANGCTASAQTTVSINQATATAAANPQNICTGESSTLSATGGGTYTWNTGQTGPSINVSPTSTSTYSVIVTATNGCTASATVTVNVNETTASVIALPDQICAGSGESSTLLAQGGVSYLWSTGDANSSIDVTPATTTSYTVTVTSATGCTDSATVMVTVNPPPATSITGANPICINSSITLNATGGPFTSYQWSTGANTASITVSPQSNATYEVLVTNANGCTASASANVPVNPLPQPSIGGSLSFCPGSNTVLDAGAGYASYQWSPGGSSAQTLTVSTGGTYSVVVTDFNGCTGSTSVQVSVNSVLTPNITGDLSICQGTTTELNAGSGFTSYAWSNGGAGQFVTVPAGTYTVTVSGGAGCTGTGTTTIVETPNPQPQITGDASICTGETTILSAGNYAQYNWGSSFNATLSVGTAGTYAVTVTDAEGCTGSDEFTVTENIPPTPTISGNVPFCIGTSIALEADAGYQSYQWTPSGNGQSITASTSGTYSVAVTDANGCTGSTSVNTNTLPLPTPQIVGDLSICVGETTTLSLNNSYAAYLWENNSNADQIVVGQGSWSVVVTDGNGCTGSTSATINETTAALPNITGDTNICEGESTTLSIQSNYTSYQWEPGGLQTQSITVAPTSNATYNVTVTNADGCTNANTVNVNVNTLPTVDIGGSLTFCAGGNTTLTANNAAGGTFPNNTWTPSGNSPSILVSNSGTYSVLVSDANGCTASDAVNVAQTNQLTPAITGGGPICTGTSATLNAGSGFTSYQWSANANSAVTQTVTVNQNGVYVVTVSDGTCSGTGSATVSVNTNPTPTISGANTICLGSSTTLSTTNNYTTYTWSHNGQTSFGTTLLANEAGIYTVTVSDANGCTGTDDFNITLNNNLSPVIAGDLDFCDGSDTQLTADAGYTSYLWSSGQTTQAITANAAGNYAVLVSDAGGCTGTISVQVSVLGNPQPNITGTLSFCAGETTTLNAGNFTAYQWSASANNAQTATVTVNAADNYSVTVTDANGCTGTDDTNTAVNTAPAPLLTGDTDICEGTCSTLEATGSYTAYQWSANANNATMASVQVCPTNNATYSVTVTDGNGCTNEASISVTVNPNPQVIIGGSTSFCTGGNTTLDAGAGFTFVWSNGANTQTTLVDVAGDYCVVVTDANGCTGSACVIVTESTSLNPVITGDTDLCQGESTTLNAGVFDNYTWSTGDVTQTIMLSPNTDAQYCVTVSDDSGCTGSACIDVSVNLNPNPLISGDTELCQGESTILDAGIYDTYTWNDGSFNSTLTVSQSGTYIVTVTDANACQGTADATVIVSNNPVPQITGDNQLCLGEGTTLNAGAFSGYSWSTGDNTQTISEQPTQTTPYSVTVTNADGCTGFTDILVSVNTSTAPTFSGDTDLCEGECTDLSILGNYTSFQWSSNANGGNSASVQVCPTQSTSYTVTVTDANGCTSEGNVNVTVNAPPTAQIAGSLTFCTGGFTTLSVFGFESYVWSLNGDANPSIQVSAGGDYSVTVTDINGCTDDALVSVQESTELTPQITGDLTLCTGESTTLDAGVGFDTYAWLPGGAVTSSITTSNAGVYTVTVTDVSGCSGTGTAQVVVNLNPVPVINGLSAICMGSSTLLETDLVYDGYVWGYNGQNSFDTDYTATDAGDYFVTVTDANGCTGTDVFSLTVNQNLSPQITGDLEVCADETIVLDAGVGFTTYTWSPTGNGQTITPTQSGTYSVTVTDANGCTGSDAVQATIHPMPSTNITGTLTFCIGASTALDAGAGFASYAWSNAETTQVITINTGGTYSVTITDSNGCTASASSTAVEQDCTCDVPLAPVPLVQDLEICEGVVNTAAFTLNTAANTIVQWYDGADAATANLLATGTSFVPGTAGVYFAFAQNDPIDDCISAGVPFSLTEKPVPNAAAAIADANVCVNESTSIEFTGTAQSGASYQWNFGVGASPATASSAGAHNVSWTTTGNKTVTVTVTDDGCTDTATANIGVSATTAAITPSSIIISGGSDLVLTAIGTSALNGDLTYEWSSVGSLSCTDCPTPTVNPDENTLYEVLITDEYGCVASASAMVNVTFENIVVIPNAFTPNSAAPNNLFRIQGVNIAEVSLEVRNRWGNKVYAESFSDLTRGWDGFYKSKECEVGVYVFFATVRFNDGTEEFFKGNVTLIR